RHLLTLSEYALNFSATPESAQLPDVMVSSTSSALPRRAGRGTSTRVERLACAAAVTVSAPCVPTIENPTLVLGAPFSQRAATSWKCLLRPGLPPVNGSHRRLHG